MDSMAMKSKIKNRAATLEARFADIFKKTVVGNRMCFQLPGGVLFAVDYMGAYGALVIEYADNYEEAKLNRFEDGDLFYLEEMDEDTMFQAMLREIKQ